MSTREEKEQFWTEFLFLLRIRVRVFKNYHQNYTFIWSNTSCYEWHWDGIWWTVQI